MVLFLRNILIRRLICDLLGDLFEAHDIVAVTTLMYELLATTLLAYGCFRSLKSVGPLKEQTNSLVFLMLKEGEQLNSSVSPLGSLWRIHLMIGLLYAGYVIINCMLLPERSQVSTLDS